MLTEAHIRQAALEVGFDDCGVAVATRLDEDAAYMDEWLQQGLHGEMSYLERNRDKRYDIRELVPQSKTVVVCLLTYEHSGRDYHRSVKSLLYQLEANLIAEFGEEIVSKEKQHIFCDSAPVLERRWATLAGLGFIGKNHQLIHPTLGSLVHPGELVLQVEVEHEPKELVIQGCGDCRRCVDACPRQALGNTVWDARRCIAYETHKCTVCQINCPYNEKSI